MLFAELNLLTNVKDVVQVVFFCIVATVTVLTYLKAKNTLLQPLRTELFKEQLKLLSETLALFTGKLEVELREEYGLSEMFFANATLLMDEYAQSQLEVKLDRKESPYGPEKCPGALFHPKTKVQVADDYIVDEGVEEKTETKKAWSKYYPWMIKIPKTTMMATQRIQTLIDSPLLPTKLAALLKEFCDTITQNIELTRTILHAAAKELPKKYPDADSLRRASLMWLHHRYVAEFIQLEPKAAQITAFARLYFRADKLFDPD